MTQKWNLAVCLKSRALVFRFAGVTSFDNLAFHLLLVSSEESRLFLLDFFALLKETAAGRAGT